MPADSLSDLNVRRDAIFTADHAFVWASAGTGKTHTLTLRALYLLLHPERGRRYGAPERSNPREAARSAVRSLVLTTFTRKAAAEMQERLVVYLDTVAQASDLEGLKRSPLASKDSIFVEIIETALAATPSEDFRQLRKSAQALAECASELQISTIHSLAASILRRHPFEAGIHPRIRFAEDEEGGSGRIKDQLFDYWWQHEAFGDRRREEDLNRILDWIPVSDLQEWLGLTYDCPWLLDEMAEFSRPEDPEALVRSLGDLAKALGRVKRGKVPRLTEELTRALKRVQQGCEGAWTELTRFLFEQKEYLFPRGKRSTKGIRTALSKLPAEQREFFNSHTRSFGPCLRTAIQLEHSSRWAAWLRFLRGFSDWVRSEAQNALGIVSFDDMVSLAAELLATNEAVRRSEFGRLKALLVDEFQDTDSAQLDLLTHLLKRPQGCENEVLGFFVGDLKQSIYRFRGVDVTTVRSFFENYERLTNASRTKRAFSLRTNFRSKPGITRFANEFFTDLLPLVREEDRLVAFRDQPGPLPCWIQIDGAVSSAEQGRWLAAQATASTIQSYVQQGRAEARYRDVLVLTRNNRELDVLLPVLQEAGIPVSSIGARTYYRNQEVLDLLNLLVALHHPFDSVAVAGVLRSPLVQISDEDIHRLQRIIPPGRLFHSEDPIPGFIQDAAGRRISRIRELAAFRSKRRMTDWLREVRSLIPAAAYTKTQDGDARAVVRVDRLLRRFREVSLQERTPALVWLLNQRSKAATAGRWDEDCGEDVSVFDESVDAVRAMTIHKAKGLESRLAIIYSWTSLLEETAGTWKGAEPKHLDLVRDDGSTVRGFSMPWGPLRVVSDGYEETLELEARRSAEEAVRLAYVAVTRACDQLAMIQLPSSQKGQDLIAKLDQRLENEEAYVSLSIWERSEVRERKPHAMLLPLDLESYRRRWTLRQSVRSPAEPLLRYPTDLPFEHQTVGDKERPPGSAPVVGTLVHAYLERYLCSGFETSLFERVWKGLGEQQADEVTLLRARAVLDRFLSGATTDQEGRSYSDRLKQCKILAQETPVFLTLDRQPWHGVVDLIIEDRGEICAVDFKTGAYRHPLPDRYLQQAKVYGEAIRRLFPLQETRFEFWWLG